MKQPKSSPPRKRGSRSTVVEVACIPNQMEAAAFLKQLVRVIARKPNRIVLRFLAVSGMSLETALAAYELLQDAKSIRIEAEAVSSIIGPALILFLLAEHRTMRRTGFLFFPPEEERDRNRERELLRDPEAWKEDPDESDPRAWLAEIRRMHLDSIRSIVQRHIPWSDITRKPLSFEAASDYGLLGGNRITAYLDKLEAEMAQDNRSASLDHPRGQPRPE